MKEYTEQRKHKRLPIRTNVFVSGDSFNRFKTQTMDFSGGGLFVEGKALALLKNDTLIQVQTADSMDNAPRLTAKVVWTNRYGAGIQYLPDDAA